MKTRLLFLAIAISTIICYTGCSEDEPEGTPTLIGEWATTAFDGEVETSVVVLGFPVSTTSDIEGSNFNYDFTFTETEVTTSGSYDVTVTTNIPGEGEQSETTSITNANGTATYTLNGDILTVNGVVFDLGVDEIDTDVLDADQDFTITFNGANEVRLVQNQTVEVDDPLSGGQINITIQTTTQLNRK
ncbi:MAG: hypothetical protein AAFQ94_13115 [Bacteroidota bacterium]